MMTRLPRWWGLAGMVEGDALGVPDDEELPDMGAANVPFLPKPIFKLLQRGGEQAERLQTDLRKYLF